MKQEFDACSVRPILHISSLMSMHDDEIQPSAIQPTNDGLEKCKNPCHNREINYMEKIVDLRNDICYQMQLLVEERSVDDAMEEGSTAETETVDHEDGCRENPEKPKDYVRDGTSIQTKHKTTTKNTSSVTILEQGSDLYHHRKRKHGISSLSLSSKSMMNPLENKLPNLPSIQECAQDMSSWNVDVCEQLEEQYIQSFPRWKFLLSTNHSLLLFGNGSKYDLLSTFCTTELCKNGYGIQIDGFDDDVTMDQILDLLVSLFLNGKEPDNTMKYQNITNSISIIDRAMNVGRALAQNFVVFGIPIFLIVHSLDGNLCTDIDQAALAALVSNSIVTDNTVPVESHSSTDHRSSRALRLIASIDNVDAIAALWTTEITHQFSWTYLEVHTYRPYSREIAVLASNETSGDIHASKLTQRRMKQQSRVNEQAERVIQVLRNLAPRYGEVMQILAQLQLSEMQGSASQEGWVDYKVFRAACKSRFVIDKDSKLRTLQSELSDHHLLLSKSEGSTEYVRIPYTIDKLQEILSYQRNTDL
jgi:Origin recognition complex subunit 2